VAKFREDQHAPAEYGQSLELAKPAALAAPVALAFVHFRYGACHGLGMATCRTFEKKPRVRLFHIAVEQPYAAPLRACQIDGHRGFARAAFS
jgi:hypothetical protein